MTRTGKRARGILAAALVASLIAVLVLPSIGWAQQTPPSMTLDEVVAAALHASPAMVSSQGAVNNAAAGEKAAIGAYLPSLSVTTGAGLASTERLNPETSTVVSGSADSYTAGLSAGLTVYDGGQRKAELRKAQAESDAADAGLTAQRWTTVLDAQSAFYDVLRAGDLVKASRDQVKQAEDAQSAAAERLRVGSATKSDVLRAEVSLAQAQQSLAQAEGQQTTAEYALGRLVAASGPVTAEAATSLEVKPLALTPAQLDSLVIARAPAVQAAEAQARAGDATVRAAKASYLPQVKVSAGYDWLNQDPVLTGGNTSWALRLGVSIPVFDNFQRQAQVTQATSAADAAQAQLADAHRAATAELAKDLATLNTAAQQITLGEKAVAAAQEDLRVQVERYGMGSGTMLDRLTSQTALSQAETQLVGARYDYQIARAQVEALAGRSL